MLVISTRWESALSRPERLDLTEPFVTATRREIVSTEAPAHFGVIVEAYLACSDAIASRELPRMDSRA